MHTTRRLRVVCRLLGVASLLPLVAATPAAASDADVSSRSWVWPLGTASRPPRVVRTFDAPGQPWSTGHRGVDLAGEAGETVRAAGTGIVAYAGLLAGRGVVSVVHGDLRTTYEPVRASVSVGRDVAAGDPIGALEPGGHCVPDVCLHWGLRHGETYLDPLGLVSPGPVRLLPLGGDALVPPAASWPRGAWIVGRDAATAGPGSGEKATGGPGPVDAPLVTSGDRSGVPSRTSGTAGPSGVGPGGRPSSGPSPPPPPAPSAPLAATAAVVTLAAGAVAVAGRARRGS